VTLPGDHPDRLILFDIDATLISTSGQGIRAMEDAGRSLFGGFSIDGVPFAGRLDPLIMADLLVANGIDPTDDAMRVFRQGYRQHLESRLADSGDLAKSLPGVSELLRRLEEFPSLVTGLLTGNFEETGSLKLIACGIDAEQFDIRVWGDDSPRHPARREDLPEVAFARFQERFGAPIPARAVTIVGDTPHDVRCAKEHGCRCLAVATGSFNVADLEACGPCRVVPNLSDTAAILDWLLHRD
jgi:phosphoglycolate phosphatase-like HAD superfamily hydrolase